MFADLVGSAIDGPVTAIRRHILSIVIAVVASVAGLLYGASAAMMALEAFLGPILARAAIAFILIVVAIAAFLMPWMLRSKRKPIADVVKEELDEAEAEAEALDQAANVQAMTKDQRLAMVLEALLLGFSMGSRKPARSTD